MASMLDVPADMLSKVLRERSIQTGVGKRASRISIPLDVLAVKTT